MNYAFDKKARPPSCIYGKDTPSTPRRPSSTRPCGRSRRTPGRRRGTTLPAYDVDLDKAKALLAESGVADQLNGKTIAYYESTPSVKGAAEAFIDAMGKVGITIKARKVTYQEAVALQFGEHNDYDIIVGSWGSDFPDPSGNLRPNFASENIVAGGANSTAYTNAAVDELLADSRTRSSTTRRSGPRS